jgi:hypothetical protein
MNEYRHVPEENRLASKENSSSQGEPPTQDGPSTQGKQKAADGAPPDSKDEHERLCNCYRRDWKRAIEGQVFQAVRFFAPGIPDFELALLIRGALDEFGPRDVREQMLVAQIVTAHFASMGSLALFPGQAAFEYQREFMSQAIKFARNFATLSELLDRHRGKGGQKVTVEHVHVNQGGQAIVGVIEAPADKSKSIAKESPLAITHAPGIEMPRQDSKRETLPIARDAERPLPHARRNVPRSAQVQ